MWVCVFFPPFEKHFGVMTEGTCRLNGCCRGTLFVLQNSLCGLFLKRGDHINRRVSAWLFTRLISTGSTAQRGFSFTDLIGIWPHMKDVKCTVWKAFSLVMSHKNMLLWLKRPTQDVRLSASNVSSHSAVEFSEHISPRISLPAISRLHLWSNFISSFLLLLNSCNTPTLLSESPSWSSLGSQSYKHPWTPTTGFLLLSVIVFLLFRLGLFLFQVVEETKT